MTHLQTACERLTQQIDDYQRLRYEYGYLRGRLKATDLCLKTTRKYLEERGLDADRLITEARFKAAPAGTDEGGRNDGRSV